MQIFSCKFSFFSKSNTIKEINFRFLTKRIIYSQTISNYIFTF